MFRKSKSSLLFAIICSAAVFTSLSPPAEGALNLSATMSFTSGGTSDEGSGNPFSITNNSSPGVQITGLTITLPANTIFDTATNGSGQNPDFPYGSVVDPAGGTSSLFGGSVTDGATALTINFTSFDATEGFLFRIDVDSTSGSTNEQKVVTLDEFAGAGLSVTFAGPFLGSPTTLTGTFNGDGLAIINGTADNFSTVVAAAPEPASLAIFGGLGLVGLAARWRRRKPVA
jgi:hypothetical protein